MYAVELLPEMREQLEDLSVSAVASFTEVLVMLEVGPWSGDSLNRERPENNMRSVAFGPERQGLVVYLILEDQRRVIPLSLTWIE
ncbi:hypothetical protein GCM10022223_20120 [Kineosporia mesophila]|uniref:Uncharacterized protein n=1 Tax=Kineosporia mesophila TaxID=566012 RepID=A0ABP6ZF76_9ACTN|nr:hypothetical protein [Kineosporia mesophila]MCD5350109.1 hypothetical protein [Kineosporia mesophila]